MKTTTVLVAALLATGALLAFAPGAAASPYPYERCHGDASTVEACHTTDVEFPDCVVGVHTAVHEEDVCWT